MPDSLISGLEYFEIYLDSGVLGREETFLSEMLRWNKRINLTSINNYDEALEKHLVDSLVLLPHLEESRCLLDMGSGGGLPGIPLAIARPDLEVWSVDSVGKKVNFQKHIKRLLALKNFFPEQGRLEKLDLGKRFDFVTARALSHLSNIVSWALPMLQENGRLLVMKGPEGDAELAECLDQDLLSGFCVESHHKYFLPFSKSERELIILSKTAN